MHGWVVKSLCDKLTSLRWVLMSYPAMTAVPLDMVMSPVRMLKVVVLPAPAKDSKPLWECVCLFLLAAHATLSNLLEDCSMVLKQWQSAIFNHSFNSLQFYFKLPSMPLKNTKICTMQLFPTICVTIEPCSDWTVISSLRCELVISGRAPASQTPILFLIAYNQLLHVVWERPISSDH